MKVRIHRLFELLLETTEVEIEAALGFSQAASPPLGDFLDDLDPELPLDWSNQSFQGMTRLREHVIDRAHPAGACTPDDVLITAGTAEANFLALSQLLEPGDEIVLESPGWPQPQVLGEAIGAQIKTLRRKEANGWRLDPADLAGLVSPRTRLIFLSNPNNPTGQILGETELQEIVRIADRAGAYLLCDEVYAGLEWHGVSAPAVAGLYERGISTGSVSKVLGLQGLRIGWLISPDRQVVRDAVVLRENTSEIMNVLGEAVAEIALRRARYEGALEAARSEGQANLDLVDGFIQSRPELSWHRPQAGLVGLCRLNLALSADELAQRLLAAPYRTFVVPGSAFGVPDHLRLGVGGGAGAKLATGLARLGDLLDTLDSNRTS